ncbi:cyclase family protein [Candidatus Daviesbacteria bacterium]|nr:cyclase family protein [Candidatus Daviesbacteria bacterium]
MSKIIDISLPLYPGMATYPNNPKVEITPIKGLTSTHSSIVMGSHSGTHIDAPSHIFPNGKTLDQIDLNVLIGSCRVLDFSHSQGSVTAEELKKKNINSKERILIKTGNSKRGFEKFYEDYVYLAGDGAEYLSEIGVSLVGIDSLSIKQKGSRDLRAHTSLLKNDIIIVEGLDLSRTEEGEYILYCLPLRLIDIDGSPARVILLKQ